MSFRDVAHGRLKRRREDGTHRSLQLPGDRMIDLWSNDYLGLARHESPPVAPTGSTGSRLISGNNAEAERFEAELAKRMGFGSSLAFGSGYAANTGLLSCVADRGDVVLLDSLAHASLIDGATLSFGKRQSFRHNDVDHLAARIDKAVSDGAKNVFVGVEAIYSMDGDQSPLEEIVECCLRLGAALIVDEAHSIGVVGSSGEGLVATLGLQEQVLAATYTFGKAPGSHGAAIAGPDWLRDYLINFSRPFIYSTAPPPRHMAHLAERLELLERCEQERRDLRRNIDHYAQRAQEADFDGVVFSLQTSPIQPVLLSGHLCDRVEAAMAEASIQAKVIRAPTVPAGSERLRVCLHSFNTSTEIDRLFEALGEATR